MKDLLHAAIGHESDPLRGRNRAREFLQARILLSLQDHGAFTQWAFVGGTALRFLFQLPRYSEDLDFSLASPGGDSRFMQLMQGVKSDLEKEAYHVDVKAREHRAVASAMVKFRGLLYEIGLSPLRDETFSVKVDIDTNPPGGGALTSRVVRRHYLLNLLHYDQASLLAGKLHAVLSRKYTKGRDLYDLMWYLSDAQWPSPNLELLNQSLNQTGWVGDPLSEKTWKQAVAHRLTRMDWKHAVEDVTPFLERERDVALLSPAIFSTLLGCPVP